MFGFITDEDIAEAVREGVRRGVENRKRKERLQKRKGTMVVYKEITRRKLDRILKDHQEWLLTNRKYGKQAILRHYDLRNHDLRELDLSFVDFRWSYLNGANLSRSYFYQTDLSWTYICGTDFTDTNIDNNFMPSCNLDFATYNSLTKFPKNFKPTSNMIDTHERNGGQ